MPVHHTAEDFHDPATPPASATGISIAYLTVDTEEHATRFVRQLFKEKLVAVVNTQEGGFERSYLKFGRPSTEVGRTRLTMTTTNDKIPALIDFINQNNPTSYDYPVADVSVLPVNQGNPAYIEWVKKETGSEAGLKVDES